MKRILLIALSVVLAAAGTVLVALYVRTADERAADEARRGGELVEVLVATAQVAAGEPVTQVARVSYPRELVPAAALGPADLETLRGKFASTTIYPKVPLVREMIRDTELRGAETAIRGASADGVVVPVRINDAQALAGVVSVGDRVSLFLAADGRSRVVIPRVRVVSLSGRGSTEGATSTLLVEASPQEVAAIVAANATSRLYVGVPGTKATVAPQLSGKAPDLPR